MVRLLIVIQCCPFPNIHGKGVHCNPSPHLIFVHQLCHSCSLAIMNYRAGSLDFTSSILIVTCNPENVCCLMDLKNRLRSVCINLSGLIHFAHSTRRTIVASHHVASKVVMDYVKIKKLSILSTWLQNCLSQTQSLPFSSKAACRLGPHKMLFNNWLHPKDMQAVRKNETCQGEKLQSFGITL